MENLSPQLRKEMEANAGQFASVQDLEELEVLTKQNSLRWRSQCFGHTQNPTKIKKQKEFEENFYRASFRLALAKRDEQQFHEEMEQMRSTHFPEDPLDGEPGA